MAIPWIGAKRIAFIPVWNRQVDTSPSPAFRDDVWARAFFDPDPSSGTDRSLQRYIQAMSSGRAFIEGQVFPIVASPDEDTVGAGLRSLPSGHGFDYAVVVLPHSTGPHRSGHAWWDTEPVNGITNVARVAMFTDLAMGQRQSVGVWAMELLHIVTKFPDLYNVSPQLGAYDVMACSCGTHPSSHTKSHMGWLSGGAIRNHMLGKNSSYEIHAVSLPQPQPPWRATAARIESRTTSGHFLVECRLHTDVYETGSSGLSNGIPGEGVIVYEVQGENRVFLRTASALQPGERFTEDTEDLTVVVGEAVAGGYSVQVRSGGPSRCEQLGKEIEVLKDLLDSAMDVHERRKLISELADAQSKYRRLGCLPFVGGPDVFAP